MIDMKMITGALIALAIGIAIAGLTNAFTLKMLGDVRDDLATCATGYSLNDSDLTKCYNSTNTSQPQVSVVGTVQYNATVDVVGAEASISGYFSTIVLIGIITILVAALILLWRFAV